MIPKTAKKTKRIRFPNELYRQAEQVCAQRGCTFSDFVKQATEDALADLHSKKKPPHSEE